MCIISEAQLGVSGKTCHGSKQIHRIAGVHGTVLIMEKYQLFLENKHFLEIIKKNKTLKIHFHLENKI